MIFRPVWIPSSLLPKMARAPKYSLDSGRLQIKLLGYSEEAYVPSVCVAHIDEEV